MKKSVMIALASVLTVALALSACGGGSSMGADGPSKPKSGKELSGELTLWEFGKNFIDDYATAFMEINPKVKINVEAKDFNDMHEKLLTALAAGSGAPDIATIEGGWIKKFNSIEGLEDLNNAPYYFGKKHKNDFTDANIARWTSIDGKKIIGFPWDMPPMVTWYRSDIMEENGFPSNPDELGKYMENPDNVFKIAQTLKAKDQYIFSSYNDVVPIVAGSGLYDRDLNYTRTSDKWVKATDYAKRIYQLGLSGNINFWDDKGKQAVASGKLAMVFMGSWAEGAIKDRAQGGNAKWRVTQLPFGAYQGNGGSTLSIPSQSKNKELAYAFLEWMLASQEGQDISIKKQVTPGWKPAWKSPLFVNTKSDFLGGQAANQLFAKLLDKVPGDSFGTPLDDAAQKIWSEQFKEVVEKNQDSKAGLQKIADDVTRAVSVDKQKILDSIKK
jgi:multiple sugar transport system substrate-binding protein